MIKEALIAIAFVLAVCPIDVAKSGETVAWKRVGNWQIRVDPSLGNACFMIASWEQGTILRIGFVSGQSTSNVPYIILGNSYWNSIQEGKDYNLTFRFDNEKPWSVNAVGFRMGQSVYLLFEVGSWDFVDEFMRKHGVQVAYQGKVIANLRLTDSFAALKETANCHVQMAQAGLQSSQPGRDPFRTPSTVPDRDPFD
ncbi:hypothetical protein [Dichotomicrobium thermohalophilum]|uniref:Invasion protein IalB n=1 Tax=Dichotomicrobium thermohalophilum TaxID=933063 RepID=A0A397Q8A8_9HYPH|nr:hypothetical protein [Dichotomicrobium thermohalophilum]RIA55757.1 hypothetical protein BXY53_0833 [Dichotomicrobium thermohalophilum]